MRSEARGRGPGNCDCDDEDEHRQSLCSAGDSGNSGCKRNLVKVTQRGQTDAWTGKFVACVKGGGGAVAAIDHDEMSLCPAAGKHDLSCVQSELFWKTHGRHMEDRQAGSCWRAFPQAAAVSAVAAETLPQLRAGRQEPGVRLSRKTA